VKGRGGREAVMLSERERLISPMFGRDESEAGWIMNAGQITKAEETGKIVVGNNVWAN
jgi:hypothetical protein